MCVSLSLGMDEEENTDRKLQIAMLYQKLEKIKRYYNDGWLFVYLFMNDLQYGANVLGTCKGMV